MTTRATVEAVLKELEPDDLALRRLVGLDGRAYQDWETLNYATLVKLEEALGKGYPADPAVAAANVPAWEGWFAFAEHQAAVAQSFLLRARGVCRELLLARGHRSGEAATDARTWRQAEAAKRWEACCRVFQEWIWQVRGNEKGAQRIGRT